MGSHPSIEAGVQIERRVGYRGGEEPRAFVRHGTRVEVAEIVDRWLDQEHRYFKVRGTDGSLCMLRHDEAGDRWDLCDLSPPE